MPSTINETYSRFIRDGIRLNSYAFNFETKPEIKPGDIIPIDLPNGIHIPNFLVLELNYDLERGPTVLGKILYPEDELVTVESQNYIPQNDPGRFQNGVIND